MPVPRYASRDGLTVLSAGFRPFFLLAAVWAAVAIPLWVCVFAGEAELPTLLAPAVWHVHEMVFGFGMAAVAGFLLTAIPNWTGRLPLQGPPLGLLALLWIAGRAAVLLSATLGAPLAAVVDLAFPVVFLAAIAREIIAGRNWRNAPMVAALLLLLTADVLVHLEATGLAETASIGNRLGIAILLLLISLVGGRIIPSFTGNWLAKERKDARAPAPFGIVDKIVLAITAIALIVWIAAPDDDATSLIGLVAGLAAAVRLARWRGVATWREPLLVILHVGYGWIAAGFLLLALNGAYPFIPQTAALHAWTVGAIGTMILAVMTRASLGHTGRPLSAGPWTCTIYICISAAALLRVLAGLSGAGYLAALWLAALAWSLAYGLFAIGYGRILLRPRATGEAARPI